MLQFLVAACSRERNVYVRKIFFFSAGLLPILLMILYFKLSLAPPNDLISGLGWKATWIRISDLSRYSLIATAFLKEMIRLPVPLLVFYLLCLGISADKQHRHASIPLLWAMAVMLLGYFFVYVTSYQDLSWHLNTSLNRLLLQLWPSTVFIFFLFVRTPEEAARTGALFFLRRLKKDNNGSPDSKKS
jgi:hypothetical protein